MYSEDVEMVTLPGVEGQFGVYPQHVPLMTQMVPGEIIVRKDGRDIYFAAGEGLIEVTGDASPILTDMAVPADKSTKPRPKKPGNAPKPGSKKSSPTKKSPTVNASLARSLAQLHVKRRCIHNVGKQISSRMIELRETKSRVQVFRRRAHPRGNTV